MSSKFRAGMAAVGVLTGISACVPIGIRTGTTGAGRVAGVTDGACGAAEFQVLVGTSVGALNASALPENRRVIFPGLAVTQDYAPSRLNVLVSEDDEIERVYCG